MGRGRSRFSACVERTRGKRCLITAAPEDCVSKFVASEGSGRRQRGDAGRACPRCAVPWRGSRVAFPDHELRCVCSCAAVSYAGQFYKKKENGKCSSSKHSRLLYNTRGYGKMCFRVVIYVIHKDKHTRCSHGNWPRCKWKRMNRLYNVYTCTFLYKRIVITSWL